MIRIESDAEKFAASGVEVLSGWSIRKWRSPERCLAASSRVGFTEGQLRGSLFLLSAPSLNVGVQAVRFTISLERHKRALSHIIGY